MNDHTANALIAIVLGSGVAVALLTPVAAVLYRREGRLSIRSLLVLVAAAIYGVALWSYTLLPLPDRDAVACVGSQLVWGASLDDILARGVSSPGALLANTAFLQVALNVALFVPFGYFVRRVLGRGVIVATCLGAATSLLIEVTQRTGVWGLYQCAYRVFDVDDLITNTSGAILGSLLSILILGFQRDRRHERVLPDHVSLGRRWMGMICDALVTAAIAFAADVCWRAFQLYGGGGAARLDGAAERWVAWGTAGLVQLAVVVMLGRTIGEWVIAVRTDASHPALVVPGRLIKWAVGIGAFAALSAREGPSWILNAFLVVTVLSVVPGENHPGLATRLGGLRLSVARPPQG